MENSTDVLQKLRKELPYDLTILLLGIYRDKTVIWKDTSTFYVHIITIYNSQDVETN